MIGSLIIIFSIIYNLTISLFIKNRNILYCGLIGFSGKEKFNPEKITIAVMKAMKAIHYVKMPTQTNNLGRE